MATLGSDFNFQADAHQNKPTDRKQGSKDVITEGAKMQQYAVHLQVQVLIDATPKYQVVLEANAIYINSSAGTMVLKLPHSSPDSDSISASLK